MKTRKAKAKKYAQFKDGMYEVKPRKDESRFPIVEGSKFCFNEEELDGIVSCVIRKVTSNEYTNKDGSAKSQLKLCITVELDGKQYNLPWTVLDGTSVMRFADKVNFEVSPEHLVFYKKHDPLKIYGNPKKNYTWMVVRIRKEAEFEEAESYSIIED